MKLIKQLIAALNRHSTAMEALTVALGKFTTDIDELDNVAYNFQQAAWNLDDALDKLDSLKVESVTQTN